MAVKEIKVEGSELERLLADAACLDSPRLIKRTRGYFVRAKDLDRYRANKYRLIGYAPGQEPPLQ